MNLVQSKPKFSVQIAKARFVGIPGAVEIYEAVSSYLKDRPTSAICFVITLHFKNSQTIGIDFVHSTDLLARLASFSAALIDLKRKKTKQKNKQTNKQTRGNENRVRDEIYFIICSLFSNSLQKRKPFLFRADSFVFSLVTA